MEGAGETGRPKERGKGKEGRERDRREAEVERMLLPLPLPPPPPPRARAAERRPVRAPARLRGCPAPAVPAPCAPQPGSATVRAELPPPQCRGGGAPGPASCRSQQSAPRGQPALEPQRAPPSQGQGQRGQQGPGSFLPRGGLLCRTVPPGLQIEQQRQAGLLKNNLGKSYESVIGRVACLRRLSLFKSQLKPVQWTTT